MQQQLTPITSDRLRHLSTDEIKNHLSRALEMTVTAITYMAGCVAELERRGEDLSHLRRGLMPYLRSVAAQRLAPEAILAFASQKMLMRSLERMPLDRQVEIATSRSITIERDGRVVSIDTRDIRPADIAHMARTLRNPHAPNATVPPAPQGEPRAIATPASETGSGSGVSVSNPPTPRIEQRTIVTLVSEEEHREIVKRSVRAGLTISNIVRQALGLPVATTTRKPPRRCPAKTSEIHNDE